jgi:broad specificity phosphatase PhoE
VGERGPERTTTRRRVKRLYLIRHGETRALAGLEAAHPRGDSALSDRGRDQMRALAAQLRGRPIDLFLTSPYLRARHSAALLNEERGAPVHAAMALSEFLLRDDGAGVESMEQGVARGMGFLYQHSPYHDHVAVVAHDSLLGALRMTLLNLEFDRAQGAFDHPGTCRVLGYDWSRGEQNWREIDVFVPAPSAAVDAASA